MEVNMDNMDILKDEMALYWMGVIDEDELLFLINRKRQHLSLGKDIDEIPESVWDIIKFWDMAMDLVKSQLDMV